MNKTITCDECKTEFELNLQTERLDDGIEHNYLECAGCGKKYTSFYTDTNIRTQQKKVQGMWERFRSTKSIPKKEEIQGKINQEQQEIKSAMDKLKDSIGCK